MPIILTGKYYYTDVEISRKSGHGGANNLVGGELALAVSIVDLCPLNFRGHKLASTYHQGTWEIFD